MENQDHSSAPLHSTFARGFGSGAFSGAMMMGLWTGVSFLLSLATPLAFAFNPLLIGAMVVTTGLFGGVMASKRAISDSHSARLASRDITPMMMQAQSPALAPQVQPELTADAAPELARADGKRWTDVTSRSDGAKSTIDALIADRSITDQDRAAKILAARDQASGSQSIAG